jgi:hypothetical protein
MTFSSNEQSEPVIKRAKQYGIIMIVLAIVSPIIFLGYLWSTVLVGESTLFIIIVGGGSIGLGGFNTYCIYRLLLKEGSAINSLIDTIHIESGNIIITTFEYSLFNNLINLEPKRIVLTVQSITNTDIQKVEQASGDIYLITHDKITYGLAKRFFSNFPDLAQQLRIKHI